MNRPTDFAAFTGFIIFGGIALSTGAILLVTGLATGIHALTIVSAPLLGVGGLCAFRLLQQDRRERREGP